MSWWALRVVPGPTQREALARWLVVASGHAVEERADGSLAACCASAEETSALVRQVQLEFGVPAELDELPETDWRTRWRDGIEPRRIGRLLLVPSWRSESEPHLGARIILDPENAFGSGEHGSTRGALALLERHLRRGMTVIDLGSGSGILSIAAVALGAARAIGIECDEEAIPVAERNAERNGVAGATRFLHGDAQILAPLAGPADLALSNILRTVNVTLLPAIREALVPAGLAIFAGMEQAEATAFAGPLEAAGFEPVEEWTDAGWWSVAARRS